MSWLSERLSALAARLDYVRLKHITYNAGLITGSRNVSFLGKKRFTDAYRYGMFSGHMFGGDASIDIHIEWLLQCVAEPCSMAPDCREISSNAA